VEKYGKNVKNNKNPIQGTFSKNIKIKTVKTEQKYEK
jgi:hypothetical protein